MKRSLPVTTIVFGLAFILLFGAAHGAQAVSGFSEAISVPRDLEYPSFLPKASAAFTFRRMNKPVVWKTAPVTEDGDAVFVFLGGHHKEGQCDLLINGKFALSFRSSANRTTLFCGPKARLLFDCKEAKETKGYMGLYYLWVDKSLLKKGDPITLSVRHATGAVRAWFAVWKNKDAHTLEKSAARRTENVRMAESFAFDAPPRMDHAVGQRVPLKVRWSGKGAGDYTVDVLSKEVFAKDFSRTVGRKTVTVKDGPASASFVFKNLEPELVLYIYKATVNKGGKEVISLETETLLGQSREGLLASAQAVEQKAYAVSSEVVIPAYPLMKPSARPKPLKVFFLTPTNYDREIVELAQRGSIDYATTFCYARDLKKAKSGKIAKAIEKADPECMLISAMYWISMTPQLRKQILTRVSKGMGLVYIEPYKIDSQIQRALKLKQLPIGELTRGIPLKEMGLVAECGPLEKWLKAGQFGKGRILFIKYIPRIYKRGWTAGIANFVPRRRAPVDPEIKALPIRQDRQHYYQWAIDTPADPFRLFDDHYYGFLIRAMHFSSSYEGKGRVKSVAVDTSKAKATVAAKLAAPVANVTLRYRVRDRFGDEVTSGDGIKVEKGQATFTLKEINSGRHVMDIQVLDGQKRVVDFHTTVFDGPKTSLALDSLKPTRAYYGEDENPEFVLSLTKNGSGVSMVRLGITLTDGWGRVTVRKFRNVKLSRRGTTTIRWPVPRPDSTYSFIHRARVSLGKQSASCYVTFPDDNRWSGDFTAQFWGGPRNRAKDWGRLTYKEGFRGGHFTTFDAAFSNLRVAVEHFMPMYIRKPVDKEGRIRPNNPDHPEFRKTLDALLETKVRMARPYGLHGYSLGHEASLSHIESSTAVVDYDFSKPTLDIFRKELKQQYGNIAKLNASWGTRFRRFEDVMPNTYAEILPRKTNLAPWMEHRQFMDRTLNRWLRHCASKIREQDPKAKVGITGIPASGVGSFLGIDPYHQARSFDYSVQYSKKRIPLKMYRDYKLPGGVLGVFTGYDSAAPNKAYNLTEAWRYLLFGCTEISYFHFSGLSGNQVLGGYFAPDMTVSMRGKWLGEAVREINQGVGKLLYDKKRYHGGIGIYYSQNSVHATTAMGLSLFTELGRQQSGILKSLEQYGLSPAIVNHRDVIANPDKLKEFKVVFFPFCTSVSKEELKAIEAYVAQGGTAFVDPMFALYNERGHYMPGKLSSWFAPADKGYESAFGEPKRVHATGVMQVGKSERPVDLPSFRGMIRSLRKGKSVAGVRFNKPAIFVEEMSVGKGKVINASFFIGRNDTLALWLRAQVEAAGVRPSMVIRDKAGKLLGGVDVNHILGEGRDYFGIVFGTWGQVSKKTPITLAFREKKHLYDVRGHKYLGNVDRLEMILDPEQPVLLCRTDREIGDFKIKASGPAPKGGVLKMIIAQRDESPLLYRVTLEPEKGSSRVPLVKKVWVRGQTVVSFRMAHNDPVGRWRIDAEEVITGRKATTTATVGVPTW
jgi:Beta-galactosidase